MAAAAVQMEKETEAKGTSTTSASADTSGGDVIIQHVMLQQSMSIR